MWLQCLQIGESLQQPSGCAHAGCSLPVMGIGAQRVGPPTPSRQRGFCGEARELVSGVSLSARSSITARSVNRSGALLSGCRRWPQAGCTPFACGPHLRESVAAMPAAVGVGDVITLARIPDLLVERVYNAAGFGLQPRRPGLTQWGGDGVLLTCEGHRCSKCGTFWDPDLLGHIWPTINGGCVLCQEGWGPRDPRWGRYGCQHCEPTNWGCVSAAPPAFRSWFLMYQQAARPSTPSPRTTNIKRCCCNACACY